MMDETQVLGGARVAIVHEWFTSIAGSEHVVKEMCDLYPHAVLHAVYADPSTVRRTPWLAGRTLDTSFIQHLPFARSHYRSYLPLMPLAVEQFDLSNFDLVLSSSHAVAKGVLTGPDQLHISYVHSPMRYAWDLQHQYLRESGMSSGVKGWLARHQLHKMRVWDVRTAHGVDHFVANSRFIAARIRKVYGRTAEVIYPPVDVEAFTLSTTKESYYLAASRLVPYKRMDLIVEAFARMPDRRLVVIGDGPDMDKLKAKATPNVELLGYQPFDILRKSLQEARAFVFAAEEDFGILPVEAQACGTPVIAYGRGGVRESVVGGTAEPTGLFFDRQAADSIIDAVERFEGDHLRYSPEACRKQAERFSIEVFRTRMSAFIAERYAAHRAERCL